MTMTEARHNGAEARQIGAEARQIGATADATGLSIDEKRERARAALRADPELAGAEVARWYGMPADWGRKQRRAVRSERPVIVPLPSGTRGTVESMPRPARDGTPKPEGKRTRAARPAGAPWALRAAEVVGQVVVAAVAAVVSYVHIRQLALTVGMGRLSDLLPLALDGVVIITTCVLVVDRRAGRTPPAAARLGLVLGIAGSLAANAVAVDPELVPVRVIRFVLAVYPPAALAVAMHLFFVRALGDR